MKELLHEVEDIEKDGDLSLIYHRVSVTDSSDEKIHQYFEASCDFIDKAIQSSNGNFTHLLYIMILCCIRYIYVT